MFITIKKLKTVSSENWYIATGRINYAHGYKSAGSKLIGYGTTHYNALCNALQLINN